MVRRVTGHAPPALRGMPLGPPALPRGRPRTTRPPAGACRPAPGSAVAADGAELRSSPKASGTKHRRHAYRRPHSLRHAAWSSARRLLPFRAASACLSASARPARATSMAPSAVSGIAPVLTAAATMPRGTLRLRAYSLIPRAILVVAERGNEHGPATDHGQHRAKGQEPGSPARHHSATVSRTCTTGSAACPLACRLAEPDDALLGGVQLPGQSLRLGDLGTVHQEA